MEFVFSIIKLIKCADLFCLSTKKILSRSVVFDENIQKLYASVCLMFPCERQIKSMKQQQIQFLFSLLMRKSSMQSTK